MQKARAVRKELAPLNGELSSHVGLFSGNWALRDGDKLPKERFVAALTELGDMKKSRNSELNVAINRVEVAIRKLIDVGERWNLIQNAVHSERHSHSDDLDALNNKKVVEVNEKLIRNAQWVLDEIED